MLSSKLIPANQTSSDAAASLFRRNFLEAGGLKYILNVLQNSSFPSSIDVSIRQDCYSATLSLARHLLCATPSEVDAQVEESESHPAPPIASQLSKSKSVEDEMARLTIEVMLDHVTGHVTGFS